MPRTCVECSNAGTGLGSAAVDGTTGGYCAQHVASQTDRECCSVGGIACLGPQTAIGRAVRHGVSALLLHHMHLHCSAAAFKTVQLSRLYIPVP